MRLPLPIPIQRAFAVIAWERAFLAFLPAFLWLIGSLAIGWTGALALLPLSFHVTALIAFLVGLTTLVARGGRRFRWPTKREGLRRIEARNGLADGCLDTAYAEPFGGDESHPLWIASRKKLIETAGRPKPPLLNIDQRQADPFFLRCLVPLVLLAVVGISRGNPEGLRASLSPPFPDPPPIIVDAWIEPPAYTGLSPILLRHQIHNFANIPESSELHIRLRDESGDLVRGVITYTTDEKRRRRIKTSEADQSTVTATIEETGLLTINARRESRQIRLNVRKDGPPSVWLAEDPELATGVIRLSVVTSDIYPLAKGSLILSLLPGQKLSADAPKPDKAITANPSLIDLPELAGPTGQIEVEIDAETHPWAGLLVKAVIEVTDGRGQTAQSEPFGFEMPERTFYNPLSQAVIEERQKLAMAPSHLLTSAKIFGALTVAPDLFDVDPREHLILRATAEAIAAAKGRDVPDLVESLWPLALELEDDGLQFAKAQLDAAEEALREALRQGADPEEVAERIADLREAMNAYIQALAESGLGEADPNEEGQAFGETDLEEMLAKMQDLADRGANDAAESILSQLEALLSSLQLSQGAGQEGQQSNSGASGEEGDPGGASGNGQGSGPDGALSETGNLIQRQRELSDQTFSSRRGDRSAQGLASEQSELAEILDSLTDGLDGEAQGAAPSFEAAEDAMRRAADALERGDLSAAQSLQENALESLREAGSQLAQSEGSGGGEPDVSGVDPLGRPFDGDNALRAEDFGLNDPERMRALIANIRKRLEDPNLGEAERTYLESLLERF